MYAYITTGAIALPTGFFGGVLEIVLNNVSCVGTEQSLLSCAGNTFNSTCKSLEDAAIVCQGMLV